MKIHKLFIANRGEVACRVARTARKMGIRSYGVYTPQDSRTRHSRELDETTQLPAGELQENYLNQELLIRTALAFGTDALHPGYGFLAENPEFAKRVLGAGLLWVGPKPDAMRKIGGKLQAKEIAQSAGVPVAPWAILREDAGESELQAIVNKLGLPLLIKAVRGGGGRGQRIVTDANRFAESLHTAQSESKRSFGSAEVFVERFLDSPRHIEVQIVGDEHGNIISLGERDCTLQRRNQKIVEETPATILDETTRKKIISAAESLARSVHYTNAGTIEFLAQKNSSGAWDFCFMEVNARLQVEHPVTELIWGVDLVELQLKVAQGENLAKEFGALPSKPSGHAIEVRLCAEDPSRNFLPTPGPITDWILPNVAGLRLDSGFEVGDVIAQEYDSLFAKLILAGQDRNSVIDALSGVLDQMLIAGMIHNQYYLRSLMTHPDFRSNSIHTRWIDAHPDLAQVSSELDRDLVFWGKKFSSELFVQRKRFPAPQQNFPTMVLREFHPDKRAHGQPSPHGLIRVAGHFRLEEEILTFCSGWINRFEICLSFLPSVNGIGQRKIPFAGQFEADDLRTHHGPIVAQVPGVVLDVRAKANEIVEALAPILVVEAMKMEMPMSLPVPAKITGIHVKRGDRIQPGQTLVTWEPAA